jgi:hypothetical protein
MFLMLLIALLSLLEREQASAITFALLALVFLAVSLYPSRSRAA